MANALWHKLCKKVCKSKIANIKEKTMTTKHPGFKAVQQKIARREGVSMKAAGAILASATRKASPAAKRANPKLRKVRG